MALEQHFEYDCGVAAVRYLFAMRGWQLHDYERDMQYARTTPEHGTSHEGIINLMRAYGFKGVDRHEPIYEVPLFSVVNYQNFKTGDPLGDYGHYGVLVGMDAGDEKGTPKNVYIWSPSEGTVDTFDTFAFMNRFYSKQFKPGYWSASLD